MQTFKEYEYKRPDFEACKKQAEQIIEKLQNAETGEVAIEATGEMSQLQRKIETQSVLASVRHTIDTKDPFYDEEETYWNEHHPLYQEVFNQYYRAVLDSSYRKELEEALPKAYFLTIQYELDAFDPSVIELLQEENRLSSEYQKLIASAEVPFDGKTLNLSQFGPYLESTDRQTRKEASEAHWSFFEENEETIDQLYDQLVKVRDQIAKKLGYKDFVELGYIRMQRLDYNREMVDTYRKEVLKDVVPVTEKLAERQAKRIGMDEIKFYDEPLQYLDGNPTPQGTPDDIIAQGKKMYHELSEETGEFIDFLFDRELVDLLAKEGKASGGYCTFLPDYEAPFIFANFNGTSGDIDVLTHEAGHAFQGYQSRWIAQPEISFPGYESAEIHSMSMEFFTYPWMDLFFKDQTEKYKFDHLSGALRFLPYGVLVDHFQHEVYENPEWTPEERKAAWRRLEKEYLPRRDYSDSPFLEKGTYWYKQGHIFDMPFYYIDYTLAQVCALQFWKRALIDQDEKAWEDYLAICKVGGTQTFLEIVSTAQLRSPFEEGSLSGVVQAIEEELAKVNDQDL